MEAKYQPGYKVAKYGGKQKNGGVFQYHFKLLKVHAVSNHQIFSVVWLFFL
jgi:hypothetical protein